MHLGVLCCSWLVALCAAQVPPHFAVVDTSRPEVKQRILDLTNECRRLVQPTACNMVEVTWSDEAAKTAKNWAEQCACKHSDPSAKQNSVGTCGENLYMTSYETTWDEAIKAFCDEKKYFVYGKEKSSAEIVYEHYTQLIWCNSYKIGCYCAYCSTGDWRWFFVCHQCPAGNFPPVSEPYESGPTCGKCPNNCNNGLCTNPCPHKDTAPSCKGYKDHCAMDMVKQACPATCGCTTEVI